MNSNSAPQITIDCMIDQNVFYNFSIFNRYYVRKGSRNLIIFPSMLIGFAIFNWFLKNNTTGWILLILGLIIPTYSLTSFYFNTKKQAKLYKLSTPRRFYTISFIDKGIHIRNKKERVDFKWDQVYKVYRTKTNIYLYITPIKAFIIPISCINDLTVDEFWSYLDQHTTDNKLEMIQRIYN